jgi:ribosomal protein L24E
MRTYDDTFGGTKIYPGKVSDPFHRRGFDVTDSGHCSLNAISVYAEVNSHPFFRLQGKLYVRGDSKIFRFQNGKTESLFLQRKNPRLIAWTTLYRRQHRKGISEVSDISLLSSVTLMSAIVQEKGTKPRFHYTCRK